MGKPEQPGAAPHRRTDGVWVGAALFAVATAGLVAGRAGGWVTFSWLEIVGSVTGAACVLLVVARHVWNFPLGIASCAAYLAFFRLFAGRYHHAREEDTLFPALVAHLPIRPDSGPVRSGRYTGNPSAYPTGMSPIVDGRLATQREP